jgi:hypothetical protein
MILNKKERMKIDEEYCNIIEKSRTDIIERNI